LKLKEEIDQLESEQQLRCLSNLSIK
jgi:hypothetical protein